MPYKDSIRKVQRQRDRRLKPLEAPPVLKSLNEAPDVTPWEAQAWQNVKNYISRPSPRMKNLERLQRIAGSLGKNAGEVRFGIDGLTMKEIGDFLGILPAKYPVNRR